MEECGLPPEDATTLQVRPLSIKNDAGVYTEEEDIIVKRGGDGWMKGDFVLLFQSDYVRFQCF